MQDLGKRVTWLGKLLTFLLPLLSAILLPLCHFELASSQALKSYGESCDADCDERQLLTCSQNSSICECMQPTSMFYDKNQGKCVGRAGFPCTRYGSEFHCLPHAECNRASKSCNCEKGYFETENGSCSIMAKYGDSCSSKRPCDRSSGMACMEKTVSSSGSSTTGVSGRTKRTCQCTYPSDQYYDSGKNSCISYAGGNCSFSWPCVRNAVCSEDIYELRRGENIHGKTYNYNVTIGKKCACQQGASQTRDRQCLRSYQQPCDPQSDLGNGGCNSEENLKCFDASICLCSNPLSQIYDKALHKCVYLVGARCVPSKEEMGGDDADTRADKAFLCTSNAECNAVSGICECKSGYSSSPYLTCLKDYGTECSSGGNGNGSGGDESARCNFHRGLSCHQSSGTCGCIDEDTLKYDANTKTCLSVVEGGPCGTFEYSDSTGFVAGRKDGGVVMIMGNHNMEVIGSRGSTPPNTSTVVINTSNNGGSHNNATSSTLPVLVTSREKLFLATPKIQIKCKSELACVNEFGEIMRNGGHNRDDDDGGIFQGFCHRRI